MRGVTIRVVRGFGLAALFVAAACFGIASGVLFAFVGDLPQISALDDYAPNTITRVLGRDGAVIGEFATERRQVVTYEQIPAHLRQAILAAEDATFEHHAGLRLGRILVTLVQDVVYQRTWGASTLTQQLARKLFLTDEKTPQRKIREALLTIQIEKRYTKQEIFTLYCNQMYWGHGAYGVEAASQLYFAKPVTDLTLDEAAMIAGIIQGNVRQSPYRNMAAAVRRRNYALDRMAAEGFITAAEAEAAKARPIVTRGEPLQPPSLAPYAIEAIRIQLEDRYGAKALDQGGLTIRTGLDAGLQRAANAALDAGLRAIDKRRGFRRPALNVTTGGQTIESYTHPRWARDPADGAVVPAVVTGIEAGVIQVKVGRWRGTIDRAGSAWINRRPEAALQPGDLVEVRVRRRNPEAATFAADLEQAPEIDGAVLALDNRTGEILAMVGGRNFQRSQFNRATQALRQVGSLYKPFVYAAAVDRGYTATSILDDSPASFVAGPGQPPYEPRNYDREYRGPVSLRQALEESRNVPAVRLMAALGPAEVNQYARRLGITAPLPPYLSVAIGSAEATLVEMTSAYTAFANQGVRMTPALLLEVIDREGHVLEQHRPVPHEALRADTAYVIANLMRGVIRQGTARAAAGIDWPLAGKTGTTDDYTDAWFIGFDPDITVGVWLGFDQKRPIGDRQTGTTAALPIWIDVMQSWVARQRGRAGAPPDFERPGNIVLVPTPGGLEAYIAGTEPGGRDPM